ncbi:hypothetical protein R4666_08860 [Acinetobacter baumannii]|nr:hypothetical protein [Acinetobacter baumannii]
MNKLKEYLKNNYEIMRLDEPGRSGKYSTFQKKDGLYTQSVLFDCDLHGALKEIQVSIFDGENRHTKLYMPEFVEHMIQHEVSEERILAELSERVKSEFKKQYTTDLVKRFGGVDRVEEASWKMAMDDVYCWELDKWVTQGYWKANLRDTHTGVTLRELAIAARI